MSATTPAIQNVPLADLRAEYIRQAKVRVASTRDSNVILAEIRRRYLQNLIDNLLKAKGKEIGEGTDTVDGVKMRVAIKQSVSWDTEKLKAVYGTLPGEVAEKIFALKLSVPEKVFNALTDAALIEKLTEARTTTASEPAIEFVIEKEELSVD